MDDYIKREDAIKTVYKLREHFKCWDRDDDIAIKNALNAISTADVRENVRGYWKKRKDKPMQNWYQCSNCGAICGETPKYCSECGADMRGES